MSSDNTERFLEMVLKSERERLEEEAKEEELKKQQRLAESKDKEEDDGQIIMPMIPMRGLVLYPNTISHFDVAREKSVNALEAAMDKDKLVFLTAQKDEAVLLPKGEDYYKIGVVARARQMLKMKGDGIRILVDGVYRAKVKEIITESPYTKVSLEKLETIQADPEDFETQAMMRLMLEAFKEYGDLKTDLRTDVYDLAVVKDDPDVLSDTIAIQLAIDISKKQEILETLDAKERIGVINRILFEENQILHLEEKLSEQVQESVKQNQKEYYLREQMKAIQSELGYGDDAVSEADQWIEELKKLKLDSWIEEKVTKEISKFTKMNPSSADSAVIRNYVETIISLPWKKSSKTNADLKKAEKILNEDHYGLGKVKDRILEYLAVIHLSKAIKGPIVCLVGPPGVGKTSIARSIARATEREFVRMSLGGVRDEAEIRGHRRTYIGAIPGRVINAIKDAGTNNPVFLFDEVDKIGSDFKGDPASALLEVLDPEQNKEFTDHFLEIPFDLSKVMFITTANTTETIPRPLLDRMEIIQVSGYTEEEKVKISQKYLIPKQLEAHGLKPANLTFSEGSIRDLINYYTRESGVRNLEREIGSLCRKVARKIVSGKTKSFRMTPTGLEKYLGKHRFRYDTVLKETEVGVTTGLAWTQVGGDTLFIETSLVPGSGKIELTGQLGEVMQESAKTAITYIRSIAAEYNIEDDFYKKYDLHVHVPEGAVPKDGPSAGVTMFTSVMSTLTGVPVKKDVAMTGEITLRGKVLPVGGIKEKVLAAHRAGIKTILLPSDNKMDIDDIPQTVRKQLEFVLLNTAKEALDHALEKDKR